MQALGQWVYYIYSGDSLIGEVRSDGTRYAYTWGEDGLLSQRSLDTNSSKFYHFGVQGETRYLTDITGSVTDSYNYTAYGVSVSTIGGSYNPFRYGGKYGYFSDGNSSKLILAGQRFYHPNLMRWITRDPIREEIMCIPM